KISRSPTKRRSTDTPAGANAPGANNASTPATTAPPSKPTRKKRSSKSADTGAAVPAATTPAPAPAPPAGASGSPANGATWTPSPQTTTGVPATPEAKPPTYDNFNSGFAAAGLAPQLGHALWPQPQWPAASAAPLWGAAPLPYYNGYTAYGAYDPSKHWPAAPNAATQFRPADNTASSWNWGPLAFPPGASTAPTPHKDNLTVAGAPGGAPSPYNVQAPPGPVGAPGAPGAPVNTNYGAIQQHGGPHGGQPQHQLGQQLAPSQLAPQPNPAHMTHLQLPAQVFPPSVSSASPVHPNQTSVGGGPVTMFSSPMDLASSAGSLASMQ
ncbi:hypothetical protein BIW11_10383, partial [Tropilaelaps mercedesae]